MILDTTASRSAATRPLSRGLVSHRTSWKPGGLSGTPPEAKLPSSQASFTCLQSIGYQWSNWMVSCVLSPPLRHTMHAHNDTSFGLCAWPWPNCVLLQAAPLVGGVRAFCHRCYICHFAICYRMSQHLALFRTWRQELLREAERLDNSAILLDVSDADVVSVLR